MRHPFSLSLLLILLVPSVAVAGELTKKIGSADVVIRFPDADGWWAERVLGVLEPAIPAMEKAAGFPCPARIEVEQAQPEAIAVADAVTRDGKIFAQRQVRGVSILWHVAARFSASAVADDWAKAGLAHFYVYAALKGAPRVYDSWAYRDEVLDLFYKMQDVPLAGVKVASPTDAAGAKAFAFFYAFARRSGGDGAIARLGGEIRGKTLALEPLKAALAKVHGKPLDGWYPGWIAPGAYAELKTQYFGDGDGDGHLDGDEAADKTKADAADSDGDGFSDGEEALAGDGLPKAPPAVKLDGDPAEWKRLRKLQLQDRDDDAKGGVKAGEVKMIRIGFDDKFLYACVETAEPLASNPDVVLTFCFDANANDVWDDVVMFRGGGRSRLGQLHDQDDWGVAEWKNHRLLKSVEAGPVVELRIPLSALTKQAEFTLLVFTSAANVEGEIDTALKQEGLQTAKFRIDPR